MTGTWATGWATGDIVTASEFKKGAGAIFDSTLGGSAATIDVTSIVATYAHLRFVFSGRGDTAALSTLLILRLNNDSGANYDYQSLSATAAAAAASETFAQTSMVIGSIAAATAGASLTGHAMCDIPNYAGTTFNKSVAGIAGFKSGTTTTTMTTYRIDGHWRSTAAINRITLLPGAGSFIAGSRLTDYALGA